MMIRTRIAPSPTGPFHIGTARAALFNYLYAKHQGGKFILRIEDTDLERSDKKFEKDIFDGMRWLGLVPDESPEIGGPFGPYRQSERLETYEKYLSQLLKDGAAFYCPHSEEELERERKNQTENKESPRHICSAREQNLKSGIIRFKNTKIAPVIFNDMIRGDISFDPKLLGDFSLAKDVRTPLYNFAVVVDDKEMDISHVIRGEDHISNTPKQLLIIEALGFSAPRYAHLPLILGLDRSKLSKRHGATSINEFRELGYLPEAMINGMAFLGWNPGGEREIFSLAELEKEFSLEKVQMSGAIFNQEKLDWLNAHYIKQASVDELTEQVLPYLQKAGFSVSDRQLLKRVVALEQPRLKKLSDIVENTKFLFKLPEYNASLLQWKETSQEKTLRALEIARKIISGMKAVPEEAKLQELFFAESEALGGKGELLWPLRVSLSGQTYSPGPFEIIRVLGREETLRRIDTALKHLKAL